MLVVPWSTALKSAATGAREAVLRGSGTSTIDDTLPRSSSTHTARHWFASCVSWRFKS